MSGCLHEGHRERLKKKFWQDSLEEHELLELLLFAVISRKNTNELAHSLIRRFGSLFGVISASPEELKSVSGVGDTTALYLKAIHKSFELCQKQKARSEKRLNTSSKVENYLINLFGSACEEQAYLLIFNNSNKLTTCIQLSKGNLSSAKIDIRKVIDLALSHNAVTVVLAHNHPDGITSPSKEDIAATEKIKEALENVNIRFLAHFIVCGNRCCSFCRGGSWTLK